MTENDESRPYDGPRNSSTSTSESVAETAAGLNLLARIIAAGEALDCGDVGEARAILADVECDLTPARPRFACASCGLAFEWPGLAAAHELACHVLDEKEEAAAA